jgi:hypothetical protein
VPRDFWLERWEIEAIIQFQAQYPLEGCRRLCFMMLDRDVVAVSPSSVYRVLRKAGLLGKPFKPSRNPNFLGNGRANGGWLGVFVFMLSN